MNIGAQNELWAKKIIDGLISLGVDQFCCAPGSRSTPLLLAVASHPKAKTTVHFDERGLAFHALGYGKAARKPAAVIATSGTAVGNLLPAVMEASNDFTPLLMLSADRPPELQGCGANQTCDQVKLFENFVRWQCDLPCPDPHISDAYLASTLSHAVSMTTYPMAGPVQLNCMFREPLFGQGEKPSPLRTIDVSHPVLIPSEETLSVWAERLAKKERGVIVAGSSSLPFAEALLTLAERLQWPIFADILSPLRSREHPCLITHFDPILKIKEGLRTEAVIQFGNRFVSKTLAQWLGKQTPAFYLHVSDHPMRQDPNHFVTHRVLADPALFAQRLSFHLERGDEEWMMQWKMWDTDCQEGLHAIFANTHTLTEPGVIGALNSLLPQKWNLFLANSMPIRDANQFFCSSNSSEIFGNRGVSGIDGNIATACGLSAGNGKPTLALIGDLTFLHDLNSLAMLRTSPLPIILCVINNDGGGIFSFLPISQRKEAFEPFIATPHGLTFKAAAELFQIPYFHPRTSDELEAILQAPKSCLIEITTDRVENHHLHEQILTSIRTCLKESSAEIPVTLH